ncbi:hypothetical protein SB783_38980 [Paraburkholderia sp. SIMBA_009]
MSNRSPARRPAGHSKALQLPMARHRASELILRTRLMLERARHSDIDQGLINHLAQVCIISGHIARAGHGLIPPARFDWVEQELAQTLLAFHESGAYGALPAPLLDGLTEVVNEYDRMLGTVRLELFAKASDYLDQLMTIAASGKAGQPKDLLKLPTRGSAAPAAT